MHACQNGDAHALRREIDLAVGVLMGVGRCTEREAFGVIAAAVHSTGLGSGSFPGH